MIKENIIKYRTSKNEKGRKAETQLDFTDRNHFLKAKLVFLTKRRNLPGF